MVLIEEIWKFILGDRMMNQKILKDICCWENQGNRFDWLRKSNICGKKLCWFEAIREKILRVENLKFKILNLKNSKFNTQNSKLKTQKFKFNQTWTCWICFALIPIDAEGRRKRSCGGRFDCWERLIRVSHL